MRAVRLSAALSLAVLISALVAPRAFATTTRTATPSRTSTPKATPSRTPTRTRTPTPTRSATPTISATPTPSVSATPTATASATATATLTPTALPTVTGDLTGTPLDQFGKPFPKKRTVTLIDSSIDAKGNPSPQTVSTLTDKHGNFAFKVSGLTPPFLVEGPASTGRAVSVAFGLGHVNVNAYTNLVVSLAYDVQGFPILSARDVETNFMGDPANQTLPNPPTPEQIRLLSGMLETLLRMWMNAYGVPPGFNLFTSEIPLTHQGFQRLLADTGIRVSTSQGAITAINLTVPTGKDALHARAVQGDKFTFDSTNFAGVIFINETVRASGGFLTAAERTLSTLVPPSPPSSGDLNQAIDGANILFRRFADTINGNGPSLTASALTGGKKGNNPLLDPAYINEGELQAMGAADLATHFRGALVGRPRLYLINSFDGTLLEALVTISRNGTVTLSHQIISCPSTTTFANGTPICAFFGNQRIAKTENAIQVQRLFDSKDAKTITPRQNVAVEVDGLESDGLPSITGAAIQDCVFQLSTGACRSPVFPNPANLNAQVHAKTETFKPSPSGKPLVVPIDVFVPPSSSTTAFSSQAPFGDIFNLTLTPGPIWSTTNLSANCSTGNPSDFCYSIPETVPNSTSPPIPWVAATTNEMPPLISPPLNGPHTIKDAKPGRSLLIRWAQPATFQLMSVRLSGLATDCAGGVVNLPTRAISPHLTSTSMNFPGKIHGNATQRAQFTLSFTGFYGEQTAIRYEFGSCS